MNPAVSEIVEPAFDIATHTDQGGRKSNQDRAAFLFGRRGLILTIADGLGGHEGGELAAQAFVDTVIDAYSSVDGTFIEDPNAFLVSQMIQAHRMITTHAHVAGYDPYGPKTTGVVCLIQDGFGYIAHIGDSRLYHYRGGRVLTRTEDHTESERMRRDGEITEDDMRLAKHQRPLNRCIGGRRRSMVTLSGEFALERGDLILLCTDGIWRGFDSRSMYQTLSRGGLEGGLEELSMGSKRLFKQHCDNVTTLALRWTTDGPSKAGLKPPPYDRDQQSELWRKIRQGELDTIVTQTPIDERISGPQKLRTRGNKRGSGGKPLPENATEVDRAILEIESFVDSLDDLV